jgi:hypothetical protein
MKVLLIILAILAVVVGLFVFAIMYVALVLYVENLPDNDKEQGDEYFLGRRREDIENGNV